MTADKIESVTAHEVINNGSKKEIYEEIFEQEMQDLMDYTGFNIEG